MADFDFEIVRSLRRLIALQLWELGAVKIDPNNPFRLVSGNHSPIYVNCRQLISSPVFVDLFVAFARLCLERASIEFSVVAGGETAGIPLAALVSQALSCPMIYVRKKPKDHGLTNLIEGTLVAGSRVLLVEDLITDAKSKIDFVRAIQGVKASVTDVLVIFDRLQGGAETLQKEGIRLFSATDLNVALDVGRDLDVIGAEDMLAIQEYLASPLNWHRNRGLDFIQ